MVFNFPEGKNCSRSLLAPPGVSSFKAMKITDDKIDQFRIDP
jgi:hypothetical protein